MSVAGAGGAKCPTCHTSLQYSTTPRPLPALCSRHTTYPVLCLAALAHRAGAGDAAAENVPSTHTLLESQLQIAASLLSHTIHVSFMYDSDWPSHIRRKKRRKKVLMNCSSLQDAFVNRKQAPGLTTSLLPPAAPKNASPKNHT